MTQPNPGAGDWTELLARTADRQPARAAFDFLVDGEEPAAALSYGQLDRRARAIGARLRELGLADRPVLLLYPPGVEYVTAFFGCLYAGAIAVPAYPPTRRPRSVRRVLGIAADCGATHALTTAESALRLGALFAEDVGLRIVATDEVPTEYADNWTAPGVHAGTPAFVQYTSGSTGTPRGVLLTHGNLLANAAVTRRLFGTSEATRVVSWLPMYHDMGLIGSVLGTVYCGGSCTLMSPTAFVQRPARWLEAISSTRATISGAPDFAYQLCVDRVSVQERAALDLSAWEVAFDGAEPVRPHTLRQFAETFAECGFRAEALTPCYGLAEATLLVSAKVRGTEVRIDHSPPEAGGALVSCGAVPEEHQVRIVDPDSGLRREEGTVGEIWIASPSVPEGYLGRPEESAAVFRAALEDEPGTRYLRTGDLGYLSGGELHVSGRLKDLVIIRGRNHYPQDIEESAEAAHPALSRGGGAAFSLKVLDAEELVVVHEVHRSFEGDLAEVAEAVSTAVAAAHGVRPYAVVLIRTGGLPRTSSGKVQRRACREELLAGALPELARTAPPRESGSAAQDLRTADVLDVLRTELEHVLGQGAFAEDSPLVALGLDSLGAVGLQQRIERALGRRVELDDVSDLSLTELAGLLAGSPDPLPVPAPQPERGQDVRAAVGIQPLSANERSQWLGHQLAPGARSQVIAAAVDVHGSLDTDALERALRGAVRQHPALRSTVRTVDGEIVRQVSDDLPPDFSRHDAIGWSGDVLRSRTEEAAYLPFDLEHGPLLRVTVFATGPGEHRLVLSVHHLVADLASLELLLAEIDRRYPVETGEAAPAPEPPTRTAPGPATAPPDPAPAEQLWNYWRDQLDGAPTSLLLPLDGPRPPSRRFQGDAVPVEVGRELTDALTALARQERTTPYTVLMAAWQVLLGRVSAQRDLLVATPVHGRTDPADAARIGLLADIVPVRGTLSADEDSRSLLRRTHATVRGALRHSGLPFPSLVERLNPRREAGRPALVQAVLTVHRPVGSCGALVAACALGRPGTSGSIGGLRLESAEFTPPPSQFEIGLTLADADEGFVGLLHFDPDLFARSTAEGWAASFTEVLGALVHDPDTPVGRTEVRTEVHRPDSSHRQARPLRPVHEQFADRAARTPDRVALLWDGGSLSYRELDARANKLAHRLRSAGVGPESMVALCLPRTAELVVAVIAVAKAGGAYVPLDPGHPAERINHVLRDSAPRVVVATTATLASLPEYTADVIDLGAEAEVIAALPEQAPEVPGDLDRLAYVIHTSGSTGRPKGVLVEHRGVANLFAAAEDFRFDHTDVWTLFHSYAFDFSVWELWGPLVHGGALVIVPTEATLSPRALWDLLRRHRVTVLNQTPAVFAELTAACPDQLAGLDLRHIVFGGEKLDRGHLETWWAHGDPGTRLTNMYGITEITVHATYGPLPCGTDPTSAIGLGVPLTGTDLRLLRADGALAAVGEPGEICLGGAGVARGYLGLPALTAQRFIPHPELPGRRMYRSGDLARLDQDGRLVYLGRADDQVKIRGHRIEPGEIEAALRTHPDVLQAVVVPRRSPGGQTGLVGYLTTGRSRPDPLDPAVLRAHLRALLPEYLIPGSFLTVPEIPVTGNGKVDRRALSATTEAVGTRPAAPATATERTIAAFAAEMLAVASVGRDDDLFALGWHSLLMARLALRTEEHFGVRVPLQELFVEPTVTRIAAAVDRGMDGPRRDPGADTIVRADRSRYTGARKADGTVALPEALTGSGSGRP
ncbi:amino acid adenylation domain-containing protein [Actinacidiphila yanglinensis]|uniref:Amino acid adenylation domain-containing protein n=1 Tax=Actinacidiphila yanglinensis TaxID=310779 RepID=A0A1H6DHQ1_9ACTN|nr:non-ribosomal peptide synthetase [Actinacidiphila yanglinensis]SEG84343.1 amino acid adenylation domain-containing protein [Actinacidiphila yanglinensis]